MNEDVSIKFGQRLKTLRETKGLTQESLALSIDVDKSYIDRIERAERSPNLKTIIKIADALEMPVKLLFEFNS